MSQSFDPIFSISVILFQLGNRYLKINTTKAQDEIIKHPITQLILYFTIVYYSTKNISISLFVAITSILLYTVLLNENHPFNLFPEKWLIDNKIINKQMVSYKKNYKENIQTLHS